MTFDIKKYLTEHRIVLPIVTEKKSRQTEPKATESQAKGEARRMGFERNGYYIMQTPLGWVAIEYEHPQYFGPSEAISEGMMGWDHWNDSDNAADWHYKLEDIWKRYKKKEDKAKLKADFQKWHERILRDRYGSGYDLDGWMALALISNDKLYKNIHAITKLNVRRYFQEAIKKIQADLKDSKGDEDASPGWEDGLRRMIRLAKKWA